MAFTPYSGNININGINTQIAIGNAGNASHKWKTITYGTTFDNPPIFIISVLEIRIMGITRKRQITKESRKATAKRLSVGTKTL